MKPWMWLAIVAGGYYLYSRSMVVALRPVNMIPDMPPTDELEPTEGGAVDEEQGFTGGVEDEIAPPADEWESKGSDLPEGWV